VNRLRLGFIGTGTVGTALARALARAGYPVVALASRSPRRRDALAASLDSARAAETAQEVVDAADLVFLTVPDDTIAEVAASISWPENHAAVHCSGVASVDLLGSAIAQGATAGVFHPLQSFANAKQAEANMPGSAFGIEATSDDLLAILEEMAVLLGGTALIISGDKAVYHASAVIASNYLVALLDVASGLWEHLGLTKADGLSALMALVRGTVDNLGAVGLPNALTGPIARGDVGTIERHLAALAEVAPDLLPVYKELARRTIPIARAKGGLSSEAAARLTEALDRLERGESPCE